MTEAMFPRIGHIQIAAVPTRFEPDEGEVNYPYIFALLDELGYAGYIGCEYNRAARPKTGWAGSRLTVKTGRQAG